MPVNADFSLVRYEDGILTIGLTPAANISAWDIRVQVMKRFGGDALFEKRAMSGFAGGQSGITYVNSGQGIFNTAINSPNTSGLLYGPYAFTAGRYDSGSRTLLARGFLLLEEGDG